jgi:Fe-S-cluster containining protein
MKKTTRAKGTEAAPQAEGTPQVAPSAEAEPMVPPEEAQAEAIPAVDIEPPIDGDFRYQTERGLRFGHVVMTRSQEVLREHGAWIEAIAELLIAKGVLSYKDLEARKAARIEESEAPPARARIGAEIDKYGTDFQTVTIDCAERIALCKAACCRFTFLLSRQDLDEGVVRWDYGQPYVIRQREDGCCVHNARDGRGCTVHAQRPAVCRAYDCRGDTRVWVDFERRIPNPALAELP